MVVPVFRASVASFHPLFDSLCTRLSTNSSLPKNSRLLPFASSELNPVQSRPELSFCVGTHLIPHPNKVERGGEDAFFVSCYNGGVIAVADGVSGWAEQNVDPSLFSRELMANASYFVEDVEVNYDPQILMRKAHAATSSVGSATVIVAMLERNGILKVASVGDCGLRIIRKGQITFSSSPQEHYFDCPYQLSSEAVGQTYLDAMALANLACSHSTDSNFDSPYTMEARAKGFDVPMWKKILGMKLKGGKLDDITVIVSQVVNSHDVSIS
ncbi:probable protein phosphatase 2C 26 isoform X4 [Citrus sinensis]|uniref:probable protein phosphatase 2C 26 isoform X4 n=1 Tax=Citrus sinensis TaxID=2711 RepID=UPI002279C169|nr:probable protein phosphatase 2C 26 isoform X4 [Citrus sinensis]